MPEQVRGDTVQTVLADYEKRLRQLETYPAGAILPIVADNGTTLIGFSPTLGGNQPYANLLAEYPGTATAAFTLTRPRPVLILCSFAYVSSGGTASYLDVAAIIRPSGTPGYGTYPDNNGATMLSDAAVVTNGAGIGFATLAMAFTPKAGTYVHALLYVMEGGATTTATVARMRTDAFYIGG